MVIAHGIIQCMLVGQFTNYGIPLLDLGDDL